MPAVHPPGALLASGRDADIFEYGPGTVLRRARSGRSLAREAEAMAHAHRHGYPVPEVVELSDDETELVLERVDGPSLLAQAARRPWTLARHGRLLADLLVRLGELPPPPGAPVSPLGDGPSFVHLDLHPLNVLETA